MSSVLPDFPIARDEAADPFLTDEENRELSLARLQQAKMDVNVKARRLAIMQEHKARLEAANAITRERR